MKKSEKAPEAGVKTASRSLIKSEMSQLSRVNDEYSAAQKSFMKGLINPDLTDKELLLFLKYSENLQLSPFRREIIAVVYNKNSQDRVVNTVVTKDGKMTIATRTGELTGVSTEAIYVKEKRTPIHTLDAEGKTIATTLADSVEIVKVKEWEGGRLWGATATVTRKKNQFTVTVPLSEYTTGKSVWASKPSTMIKKVALSQALTLAFPEILGGIYDESEIQPMGEVKDLPISEEDNKPATDTQIDTIKALGGKEKPTTFGEAKQMIKTLSTQKKS